MIFEKGKTNEEFPAAFRINPCEAIGKDRLRDFLYDENQHVNIPVELVRRLSPDSLSVMEFKTELDAEIAEKMLHFPLLGEPLEGVWTMRLGTEFHMTNDSHLFRTAPGPGHLPLYEGKMIHQFRHDWGQPRYWVDEAEGRRGVLGREKDEGQKLGYQETRFAMRRIASSTNERSLIGTLIPSENFASESFHMGEGLEEDQFLALTALANSFVLDYFLRQKVSANINMFYVYQLPVPRLTSADLNFAPIVQAARLICTAPEFDELAQAAGLRGHGDGVTDAARRAALRAELDGRVAHLYGLTEAEFTHILGTFPLVAQEVKDAALAAYRALKPPEGDPETVRIAAGGEGHRTEFKETFAWNVRQQKQADYLKAEVFKTVAALANAEGGTLLIGVDDAGRGVGLEADLALRSKNDRTPDKFELYLRQQLRAALRPDVGAWVRISFPVLDGHKVCRVDVQAAPKEVWFSEKLYARMGNESRSLAGADLTRYVRGRWPGGQA